MINKPIMAILAIAAVMVVGVAAYSGSGNLNPANHTDLKSLQSSNDTITTQQNNTQQTNSGQTMISASEAQSIAQKYIKEPGATAGTPNLVEINGQNTYAVPVIMNGKTVGEIDIDAFTGDNVGGAGGVS